MGDQYSLKITHHHPVLLTIHKFKAFWQSTGCIATGRMGKGSKDVLKKHTFFL